MSRFERVSENSYSFCSPFLTGGPGRAGGIGVMAGHTAQQGTPEGIRLGPARFDSIAGVGCWGRRRLGLDGWELIWGLDRRLPPAALLFLWAGASCDGGAGLMAGLAQDMSPRMATRHARMRTPRLAALGVSVGRSGGGDGVDVGRRALAPVPIDAGSGDHRGAVVVVPDEIGGRRGVWGLTRFEPLQITDDVGVVAPVFHCFDPTA